MSLNKTQSKDNKMIEIFKKAYKSGFYPVALVGWKIEDNKARPMMPKGLTVDNYDFNEQLKKFDSNIGFVYYMNKINDKLDKDNSEYRLLCLDADSHGNEDCISGIELWNKLDFNKKETYPQDISKSNGIHMYCLIEKKYFMKNKTQIKYDNMKYEFDILTTSQIIAPYKINDIKFKAEPYWNKQCKSFEDYDSVLDIPKANKKLCKFIDKVLDENSIIGNKTKEIKNEIEEINKNKIIEENNYNNKDFTIEDIDNLVNLLDPNTNYSLWCEMGMCLRNMNKDYFCIWDKWSSNGKSYKIGECTKKWKTFKKTDNGLNIGSLISWCKTYNSNGFKNFIKDYNVKKIILDNKKIFPENELAITNIIHEDRLRHVSLNDSFCPMYKNDHEAGNVYLEITPYEYTMKCKICLGKTYPCDHLSLAKPELNKIFNTMNIQNLQINNYYSNDNDYVEFEKLKLFDDNELNKLIFDSLNGKSCELAEVIYYLNKNLYNYGEDEYWYLYENHKWNKISSKNFSLRHTASKQLKEKYDILIQYYKKMSEGVDKMKKINKINNIISNLSDTIVKNNIITELTELYSLKNKGKFVEKLDNDPYLLGFENGIYDLKNFVFREGKPDDFVSMTVGYDYIPEYTKYKEDIIKFFEDIMPNKEDREYLLTLLGSTLIGININEIFNIFTGGMRNGKSTLSNILLYVFGDYYGDISNNLLTKERPAQNVPQPELLEIIKKRIILASETEGKQKINTGFIKGITGNDRCKARGLYSNDIITFIPKFKLILLCNDIPEVDKPYDNAFWNRCKCLNFPVLFTENPKNEFEKKINKNLKQELLNWKQDCMLLFLEYYKKYCEVGLTETQSIINSTKKYKKQNNFYSDFIDEYLIKSDGDHVIWSDLKSMIMEWYKINIGNDTPKAKDIKTYFETKIFKCDEKVFKSNGTTFRGWNGYKLLSNDEKEH